MNFQNFLLPINVFITIIPGFNQFKGIENLVRSCKQATINEIFPINLKAKISLQTFNSEKSNDMIFTLPKQLDCILINQRYLKIQFTLEETGHGITRIVNRSIIFLCAENSEIRFVPCSESQFSFKCEIEILPKNAEDRNTYPCIYRKMLISEKELKYLDKQSGWSPVVQPIRQPSQQAVRQPVRQQTVQQMTQQNQRPQVISPIIRDQQQIIARYEVEQQLCIPTNELIIGSDGSFFVRNRTTNTILYEGTFNVYRPGTIKRYPNALRCVLSNQPLYYQPVYQQTNQPIQRTINVFGNPQPIQSQQMSFFGLPQNINQSNGQQQQQRKQPNLVQQPQTKQILPINKKMKPMEEESKSSKDIEKDMSTGKHYEPISIDLSAEDDDRTITAENSETEELP